ncbi:amidohydrolase family protein [Mammaliicoccus sciuri]|uniref:amidohydrolase family protein n=1 Tax=Mammaliicoccus sciuri TaxID=1296 RepID=UPI003A90139A
MKIFDAHFHIIDFNYEVKENNGYIPPSYLTEDYQEETQDMNIAGGAIVSGSFQGFDQQYLLKALSDLGSDFCGVTQLPYSVSDEEIVSLNDKGIHVKATGFSRVDLNVQDTLKEIYHANPDALMFGTDLPSTCAPKRFTSEDIQLVQDTFDEATTNKIFYQNAKEWYRK